MHIAPGFTLDGCTMFVLNVPSTKLCRIKYSISIVADKGLKKPLYTSARLKKGEVLYLETHSCRYVKSHGVFLTSHKQTSNKLISETHDVDISRATL